MYEASYWGLVSAYTIIHVQAGLVHVICLGISLPYPDSAQTGQHSPVGHCNICVTALYSKKYYVTNEAAHTHTVGVRVDQ